MRSRPGGRTGPWRTARTQGRGGVLDRHHRCCGVRPGTPPRCRAARAPCARRGCRSARCMRSRETPGPSQGGLGEPHRARGAGLLLDQEEVSQPGLVHAKGALLVGRPDVCGRAEGLLTAVVEVVAVAAGHALQLDGGAQPVLPEDDQIPPLGGTVEAGYLEAGARADLGSAEPGEARDVGQDGAEVVEVPSAGHSAAGASVLFAGGLLLLGLLLSDTPHGQDGLSDMRVNNLCAPRKRPARLLLHRAEPTTKSLALLLC